MLEGAIVTHWKYASTLFSHSLLTKNENRALMRKAHRLLLIRSTRSYRTASYLPLTVIERMPPMEYLVHTRAIMYTYKNDIPFNPHPFPPLPCTPVKPKTLLLTLNKHILKLWRKEWEEHTTTGQWTMQLIPEADAHSFPTTFWTTQILTVHGLFRAYLYKFHRSNTPACPHCQHPNDTAEHALKYCTLDAGKRPPLDQLMPTNPQFRYFSTLVMRSRWQIEKENHNLEQANKLAE